MSYFQFPMGFSGTDSARETLSLPEADGALCRLGR